MKLNSIRVRQIIALGIMLVILGILLSILNALRYGKLVVPIVDSFTKYSVNGTAYTSTDLAKGIKLRPGEYTINASGPTTRPETQKVKVPWMGTVKANLTAQKITPEEIMRDTGSAIDENSIPLGEQFFENDTWLVLFMGGKDGNTEVYTNVYRLTATGWELLMSGTGFTGSDDPSVQFPRSVSNYLANPQ